MATLIVAGVVSLAWCAFAIWLGPRIGYVDRPDDPTLKAHERPAVPLGGVGIKPVTVTFPQNRYSPNMKRGAVTRTAPRFGQGNMGMGRSSS